MPPTVQCPSPAPDTASGAHRFRATRRRQAVALGAAGCCLAGLFLAVSITPLTNNDIWLHMANGDWILTHGKVPLTDPYSFSAAGRRFYAHEWLAGVIFALIHRAAGVTGLILFKTLLGGLALAGVAGLARRRGAGWISIVGCTTITLAVVNSRFLERPEMFSYALTALYLWVFSIEHERLASGTASPLSSSRHPLALIRASRLWLLVPVQWLWVQLHGYFLTGVALTGLFLIGEWLGRWSVGGDRRPDSRDGSGRISSAARPPVPMASGRRRLTLLATPALVSGSLAGGAMLLVGLLNPNGHEIYTFPFKLAGTIFTDTIFEWQPTFTSATMTQSSMFLAFTLWLGLLAVGCIDARAVLHRHGLWRVGSVVGLGWMLIVRSTLPGPLHPGGLAASTWLWSPAELLFSWTGRTGAFATIDAFAAPLRAVVPWGDDLFTLLWVSLAIVAALSWRRPARAALPILAVSLMFLFSDVERVVGPSARSLLSRLSGGSHLSMPGGLFKDLWMLGPAAVACIGIVLGSALLSALRRRRWHPWEFLVTVFFLYMAVKQNRNIVNFALLTMPFGAAGLSRTWQAMHTSPDSLPSPGDDASPDTGVMPSDDGPVDDTAATRQRKTEMPLPSVAAGLAVGLALLLGLTLTAGWPYTARVTKRPGLGVGPQIPVGAVTYIRRRGITGHVFNKYAYGAYLIHELYPDTRVFMDSRNDVYGPEIYSTYLKALDSPEVTRSVFSRYDLDYVLVDYAFYPSPARDKGLITYLQDHPEWVLVYFDSASLLYLKDTPEHAAIIEADGYRRVDPTRYTPGIVARLPTTDLAAWGRESARAVEAAPGAIPPQIIRVDFLTATGRAREAMDMLRAILARDRRNMVALVAGARLAHRLGHDGEAREYYARALHLRPAMADLRREAEALPSRKEP
ncbi:MAG: tetratricopeptide repeat protein [Acidobacteriota bacterium]